MRSLALATPIALILAVTPSPSQAYGIMDGNELHRVCGSSIENSAGEAMEAAFCIGFIRGAFEQLWANEFLKGNRPDECIPSGVTNEQIIDVVKRYLRDHPAERHLFAINLIQSALSDAFPRCF